MNKLDIDLLAFAECMSAMVTSSVSNKDFQRLTGLARRTYQDVVSSQKASIETIRKMIAAYKERGLGQITEEDLLPVEVDCLVLSDILIENQLDHRAVFDEVKRWSEFTFGETMARYPSTTLFRIKEGGKEKYTQLKKHCVRSLRGKLKKQKAVKLFHHELTAFASATGVSVAALKSFESYQAATVWLHDQGLTDIYRKIGDPKNAGGAVKEEDARGIPQPAPLSTCQAVCATVGLRRSTDYIHAYNQLKWLERVYHQRAAKGRGGWSYLVAVKNHERPIGDPIIEAWAALAASLLLRHGREEFAAEAPEALFGLDAMIQQWLGFLTKKAQASSGGFSRYLPVKADSSGRYMTIVTLMAIVNTCADPSVTQRRKAPLHLSLNKGLQWLESQWGQDDAKQHARYLGRLAMEVCLYTQAKREHRRGLLDAAVGKKDIARLDNLLSQAANLLVNQLGQGVPDMDDNPATEQSYIASSAHAFQSMKHYPVPWSYLALHDLLELPDRGGLPYSADAITQLRNRLAGRVHEAYLTGGLDRLVERDGVHALCETVYCFSPKVLKK